MHFNFDEVESLIEQIDIAESIQVQQHLDLCF